MTANAVLQGNEAGMRRYVFKKGNGLRSSSACFCHKSMSALSQR